MIKVAWDQGFKKAYQKKVKNDAELKDRFWNAMEMFAKDPFHRRLRTHKMKFINSAIDKQVKVVPIWKWLLGKS